MTSDASDAFDRIAPYYTWLTNQHGYSVHACDYGHSNSQLAKFRVLSEVCDLTNRSILDVGCGFADYSTFLNERFNSVNYIGLDLTPAMIEQAHQLHPDLDLRVGNLMEVSFEEKFDVVTANGIFYLLNGSIEETMNAVITKMFELANVAVAFNSLSSWAPDQEVNEFYANPSKTLDFCRTLTPWVTLRHDYHPRDFTVYLYRNQQI